MRCSGEEANKSEIESARAKRLSGVAIHCACPTQHQCLVGVVMPYGKGNDAYSVLSCEGHRAIGANPLTPLLLLIPAASM